MTSRGALILGIWIFPFIQQSEYLCLVALFGLPRRFSTQKNALRREHVNQGSPISQYSAKEKIREILNKWKEIKKKESKEII